MVFTLCIDYDESVETGNNNNLLVRFSGLWVHCCRRLYHPHHTDQVLVRFERNGGIRSTRIIHYTTSKMQKIAQ